jgi:hypothetical protein
VTPSPVSAKPTTVPTVVPTKPATSGAPVTPPGAAPVPQPSPAVEACLPLQLTDEMKKSYESGEVCFRFTPKSKPQPSASASAPKKTA